MKIRGSMNNTKTVLGAVACIAVFYAVSALGAVSVTASRAYVDRKVAALDETKADRYVVVTNGSTIVTNTVLYSDSDISDTIREVIEDSLVDSTGSASVTNPATANSVRIVSDRNIRDLPRLFRTYSQKNHGQRAGGSTFIKVTPSALGATTNCIIREVSVRATPTVSYLPTQPVYLMICSTKSLPFPRLATSREPVKMYTPDKYYTFIFDEDAELDPDYMYTLIFYATDKDTQVNVGVCLDENTVSGTAPIYYGTQTDRFVTMDVLFSDGTIVDYINRLIPGQ